MSINPTSSDPTPGEQWRALAGEIAGRRRMRVSRDGGRTYPRRYERDISAELPNQPAAVLIYDAAGCTKTFCVDLDTSRGGREAVERDYRSLTAILSRLGLPHFADQSPNGGIHLYVPLAEALPFHDAAAAARALSARTPTMDPMPMLGIDSGCIRPPGGRHRTGGHQQLIGSLNAAWMATQHRASTAAWERFTTELQVATPPANGTTASVLAELGQLRPLGRYTEPDTAYQAIARTGVYDTKRYTTASEARQAVIWSAVAAGWDFAQVARRVSDGTWPGLAAMYARYRPHSRHDALQRDWRRAITFEKSRRETTTTKSVRVRTTRGPETHGGGVYQEIRSWLNAIDLVFDQNRRDDLAARAVLLGLAEAAQKTGSLEVEFGNRSLAIATGMDQATVGKCLNRLVDETNPLLELLIPAAGVKANTYRLTIPPIHDDAARRRTWKKGRIHAIRAAFRDLGLPAAFMHAALEQHDGPISARDLASDARLGVTTAYEALATLESFGLARRTRSGWQLGDANLTQLGEAFGVVEAVAAQLERYRAERRAYWALLGIVRLADRAGTIGTYGTLPPPAPPPEDIVSLLDLLEDVLGAHVIEETRTPRHQAG